MKTGEEPKQALKRLLTETLGRSDDPTHWQVRHTVDNNWFYYLGKKIADYSNFRTDTRYCSSSGRMEERAKVDKIDEVRGLSESER